MHLLKASQKPFFEILKNWITHGEIEDHFEEFFVAKEQSNPLWNHSNDSFSLRQEMVPSFLSSDLVHRILRVGKSIEFLRCSCDEQDMADDEGGANAYPVDGSLESGLLERLVEHGERKHNMRAVDVMLNHFHLLQHAQALKNFLFFERGDFARSLLDEVECVLLHPCRGYSDLKYLD